MKRLLVVLAALLLAASAQANLLQNSDFEQGTVNQVPSFWADVGLGPTYVPIVKNYNIPPTSNYHAEHISWSGLADAGYIYQQVNVDAGSVLTGVVDWVWYSSGLEPDNWHIFGIGIDPTGGTDWSAGTVVKTMAPVTVRSNWNYDLTVADVDATGGGTVTVFLYSECVDDNAGWWAHAFDDAELTAEIIPEPCSLFALGAGLIGLIGMRRRRS